MKKKNDSNKELYSIYALICAPLVSILLILISKIVIKFNVLVGIFMKDISIIIGLLIPIILVFDDFKPYISSNKKKRKKSKISFKSIIILLIFGGFIIYFSLDLVDLIKDCFQGTKEVYIEDYKTRYNRVRKGVGYVFVSGYDKEGNKYKLDSYKFISEYEDMGLKIKYYENLSVIESFEYVEK